MDALEFNLYFDETKLQSISTQTTLTNGFSIDYKNHFAYIRVAAATVFLLPSETGAICVTCFNVAATADGSSNLDLQSSLANDVPPNDVDGTFKITNFCSTPSTLNLSTTYYLKIDPRNNCGSASSVSVWNFTTGTSPLNCTEEANPTSGNAPLTVNFSSFALGGALSYIFYWNSGDG